MAASTGSGKTLAFVLPAIQRILEQEKLGYKRNDRRPRCLILVPTRELAKQILHEIKQLSHFSKISSTAVLGGEQYGVQKKALGRLVDIVVASPGRLLQHHDKGNIYFSQVSHVIIDEVDTMLSKGFGMYLRPILRSVMTKRIDDTVNGSERKPTQLVMATATLTKPVRNLLGDIEGNSLSIQLSEESDNKKKDLNDTKVEVNIVEVDGLHRCLPNVNHDVEETKGRDKIIVLNSILNKYSTKDFRTLIFCNTISSCRYYYYYYYYYYIILIL
jgi:superfamily II DNA/RNA helicase